MSSKLYEETSIQSIIIPQSITADKGGCDIDVANIREGVAALQVGEVTGTNPTLDVYLQESNGFSLIDRTTLDESLTWNILRASTGSANIKINVYTADDDYVGVKYVKLYLKKVGTIASGKKVWLTVEADSTGAPSGTALATSLSVLCSDISTTAGWVTFTFTEPVDLSSTDHIVLQGDYTASDSNYIAIANNTVTSGGDFQHYSGGTPSWTAVSTKKCPLEIDYYAFETILASGNPVYAFTQVTSSNTDLEELKIDLSCRKRYVRFYFDVGGTNPNFTVGGVMVLGKAIYEPI